MHCFDAYQKYKIQCEKTDCQYYLEGIEQHQCCTIIAAKSGPMTLENIGNALCRTKMRISQIQQSTIKKMKKLIEQPSQ